MKRTLGALVVVSFLGMLAAGEVLAQPGPKWRGSGGWGPHGQYARLYDPKTVESVKGEIEKVETVTPMKGMGAGIHLLVKTDQESIPVHLGPSWYVENQDVKLEPKDTVEVKGSRVTLQGKPVLLAAEVKKGDATLVLRDEAGIPAWSAVRRR
jgi:hypothetical protein